MQIQCKLLQADDGIKMHVADSENIPSFTAQLFQLCQWAIANANTPFFAADNPSLHACTFMWSLIGSVHVCRV